MSPTALIIPGFNGSGADHWQTIWQRTRHDCFRVMQACWDDPHPFDWCARLEAAVLAAAGPVVLVAHSLGCATVAHWAMQTSTDFGRVSALLVAPCDVERPGVPAPIRRFAPLPVAALPFRSLVVASSNDPYASPERARCIADRWGSALVEAGPVGHINAESGLGRWPFGEVLLAGLLRDAGTSDTRYHRAAALRMATLELAGSPCGA